MKIEEGMYVRTKYNGILKTEEIYKQNGEYVIAIYNKVGTFVDITEIIGEPSFDIIDVIQVGDYVNGKEVLDINIIHKELHINTENDILCFIKEKNIKSIVTKEQFSSMEYVL